MKAIAPYVLGSLLALSGGCSVSSDLWVENGESRSGGLYTVDGDIGIGEDAKITAAKTVDGDITVGRGSETRQLATVDGDISIAEAVTVRGSIKTVDGDIRVEPGAEVKGGLRTVDGDIDLIGCSVGGDVQVVAGKVTVVDSQVEGAIKVVGKTGNRNEWTEIEIGEGSSVGRVEVRSDRDRVRLRIHRSAEVGEIIGVEVEYFDS